MMPNMNPRAMAGAMQRMGIQQKELDAEEVIIRMKDHDLVFSKPNVSKINMMGQEMYQLIGNPEKRSRDTTPEINEEDIKTVMEQTNASHEKALETLKKTKGDIAQAILS